MNLKRIVWSEFNIIMEANELLSFDTLRNSNYMLDTYMQNAF